MFKVWKQSISIPLVLLCVSLTASSTKPGFIAPEIEPPADLIPGYVPAGFKLISGFQLAGKIAGPVDSNPHGTGPIGQLMPPLLSFNVKSPNGNDIQGVYYRSRDHILLISKSYFPKGTLDLWKTSYEAAQPRARECQFSDVRLAGVALPPRFVEFQEERTLHETRVAVLKGPLGWITVFVRGEHLLTVESPISLEENLKVVLSLLIG